MDKTESQDTATEETQETAGVSQEEAQATAEETKPATDDVLDAWKAASRKWEDRAKANKAELDKITNERALDLERVTALEAENQSLKEAQSQMLRETVAAIKGVPANRITGSTREELEADADRFLEELKGFRQRAYVPTAGQGGGDQVVSSVISGRERAREALGKS